MGEDILAWGAGVLLVVVFWYLFLYIVSTNNTINQFTLI